MRGGKHANSLISQIRVNIKSLLVRAKRVHFSVISFFLFPTSADGEAEEEKAARYIHTCGLLIEHVLLIN